MNSFGPISHRLFVAAAAAARREDTRQLRRPARRVPLAPAAPTVGVGPEIRPALPWLAADAPGTGMPDLRPGY